MYVNGAHQGTYLSAGGTGFATNATTITYQADPNDVVTLGTPVEVAGEPHANCDTVPPGPAVVPPTPLPTVRIGLGCTGRWTDFEMCTFQAPAGAFAAGGFAEPYAPPGGTAALTVKVYVLVGAVPVTLGSCTSSGPGAAACSVTVQATPYPVADALLQVTGIGNFGNFGCGDPPPLPVG